MTEPTATTTEALLTGIDASARPSASWAQVFEKIAALLSERWGIQVLMRGTDAYTDGKRIVLPVVPDNAPAELIAAVHGTLDHEAGHVIFSEFFAIPDAREKMLVNALEDAREERLLIQMWPGCGANLRACTEFFSRRLDGAGWPVSDFTKFCIALYFHERYGTDHWFVEKWIDSCDPIAPHLQVAREILAAEPVHGCATTREVQTLARKILAAIRELSEPEKEPAPDPEEDTSAGTDEQPDAAPDSAGSEDDSRPDSSQEGDGAETGDAPATEDPPGTDESPQDLAGGVEGTETDEAAAGEPATDAPEDPAARPASSDAEPAGDVEPCKDITDVSAAELDRDAEWNVQRLLSEQAREALAAADGAYLAFTTEHDVVETAPAGDRAAYQRMIQSVRGDVATIKRTLARTLLASKKARWERGLCRGKVNPAALHKIPVGIDRRVFRKRELAPAFHTRVSLLVDHSGSMIGSRLPLAARAAAVFSEVLAQLRIPFEVLGFTSGPHADGQRRHHEARPEDRALFARWGALRTIVYKEFSEDFRRVCGRLDAMARFSAGEANYDSESVAIAARRLLAASSPDERRILFVFSDGMPAGTVTTAPHWARQAAHLHEVVRQVSGSGTELFGIGIESDAVKLYYPSHTVVNAAQDLPRETVRALDRLLRRGLVRHAV